MGRIFVRTHPDPELAQVRVLKVESGDDDVLDEDLGSTFVRIDELLCDLQTVQLLIDLQKEDALG